MRETCLLPRVPSLLARKTYKVSGKENGLQVQGGGAPERVNANRNSVQEYLPKSRGVLPIPKWPRFGMRTNLYANQKERRTTTD